MPQKIVEFYGVFKVLTETFRCNRHCLGDKTLSEEWRYKQPSLGKKDPNHEALWAMNA